MEKIKEKLKYFFTPEKVKIYIYTCSQLVSFLLAFLINLFYTKFANPEGYGQYKYATNFLQTMPTFFAFGIPFCCSRLIAKDGSDEKHKVLTSGLYVTALLSVVFSVGSYLFLSVGNVFSVEDFDALEQIKSVFPFMLVFALRNLFIQVYQGVGKTNRYAAFTIAQSLIVLVGIFAGRQIFSELPFRFCIAVFIASNAVVLIPMLSRMRYKTDKVSFGILFDEIKSNGIKIYFSSVITTSASSLIALICGSQYGFSEYGYYSLALSFAKCFTLISSAMTVVKFRENVKQQFIKKSDMVFMSVLNAVIYGAFLIIGKPLFFLFFSKEYEPAYSYLVFLGFAYLMDGMTLYFNRFFIARGKGGIVVRNSSITSVINILVSVILIPKYHINGLVTATVISATYNFIQYVISYLFYRKKTKEEIANNKS